MTQKGNFDRVDKLTPPVLDERLEDLRNLFPECFSEGKIDFEKLHEVLGEVEDEGTERYSFTWSGKRDAIRLLQATSLSTLIPSRKESVNFDEAQNLFIEGDNLEVLKLLSKSYFGAIKIIYIDPPYNTGKEFVYPDNYKSPMDTYLQLTGQEDGNGNRLTSNAETSGRYHSAWLSMMYPRLFTARKLLRDDGLIFVSIDDHEVHNLRMLMNEVFGEENFVSNIIWQKKYTRSNDAKWFSNNHDYILVFARNKEKLKINLLPRTETQKTSYSNPDDDPRGVWKATPLHAKSGKNQSTFKYTFKNGIVWSPPPGRFPRYAKKTLDKLDANDEIWFGKDGKSTPSKKSYLSEVKSGITPVTVWLNDEVGNTHQANNELKALLGGGIFDNPKPTGLIKRILQLSTSSSQGDIVLDFFAGSCTTADAVLNLNQEDGGNRRFICVQLPEPIDPPKALENGTVLSNVADIGRERIQSVIARIQQKDDVQLSMEVNEGYGQLGFKTFKLSPSNYRCWQVDSEKDFDAYIEKMALLNDPLIDNTRVEDIIYEIATKEGYSLNCHIEPLENISINAVYSVTDSDTAQAFKICLDDPIEPGISKELNLDIQDLFICRDVALNDENAANLALQCRLKTI